MKPCRLVLPRLVCLLLVLALPDTGRAGTGPDVTQYLIAKGQFFKQVGTANPTLLPAAEEPFAAIVSLEARDSDSVKSATIRTPLGVTNALERHGSSWELEAFFSSKASLDGAAPQGLYLFTLDTASQGTVVLTRPLGPDAYPSSAPRILNFTNLQGADPTLPITVQWQAFPGGTVNDFIQLRIEDANGDVFTTGNSGDFNALNGTHTFATIPAGLLSPNTAYEAYLLFAKVTSIDATNNPGTTGLTAYFKETELHFSTGSPASPPPAGGRFIFASSAFAASEAAGFATITIQRVGGVLSPAGVTFTTLPGTATPGLDYAPVTNAYFFDAGVDSLNVPVQVFDDLTLDGTRTVLLRLSDPTGGADLGSASNAVLTLLDNEQSGRGVIQFIPPQVSVSEGAGQATLTLVRSGGSQGEVSVKFESDDDTAETPEDFTDVEGIVVFPEGVTSRTVTIPITNDNLRESDEIFVVKLSDATGGAALGPARVASVIILDDEVTLQFSSLLYTNRENSPQALLRIARTGPVSTAASVVLATAPGGTATPGADFVPTNLTVQFPAGSQQQVVAIRLLNDQLVEGTESLLVELSNPSANALLGARSQASLQLADDDTGGRIQFALAALNVAESKPSALVIVTRTLGLASNVTCTLATRNLSATSGSDYVGTNVVLSWRGNETRKSILIPLLPDTRVESNETFQVTLANPTGGALLDARTNLTVTLLDDDRGGVIGFARPEFSAPENAGNTAIIVTRSGGLAGGVTVRFLALEGSAASPADFTEQDVVVEFGPGQTSRTLFVPIQNDTSPEGPETVLLQLRNATGGANLTTASNAVLRLIDDESSVAFSAATASGTEGASVTLTVTRSGALSTAGSVGYTTVNGTALAGADYTATSGTLSFAANQATKTLSVPLLADPNAETGETFTVVLQNPQGGVQLGSPASVTVTILDKPDPNAIPAAGSSYLSFQIQGIEGNTYSDSFNAGGDATAPVSGAYILGLLGGSFQPITGNKTSLAGTTVTTRTFQFPLLRAAAAGVIQLSPDAANGSALYSKSTGGTGPIVSYVSNQPGASGTVTIDILNPAGDVATGRFDLILVESNGSGKKARATGSFRLKGAELTVQ
ncbi:MAG: hypothetical protein RJA22_1743 [Verrucomicrobiota bacterium]|jgi:hypothetical protein